MATKKAAKPRRAKRQKSRARKFWGRLGVTALVLFIIGGLAGLGGFIFLYSTTNLPDPNEDFTTNTTFLYYEDGRNQMGSLAVQNRVTIPYDQMPQLMKDAVVAAENEDFKANLVVKEELLAQAQAILPVKNLEQAKSALRGIQEKWDAAGKVPRSDMDRIEKGMRRVEQAVRDAEDKRWKATNPEVAARAASLASQAEAALERYRKDLAKAEASGDAKRIAKAREALQARESWLKQARAGLAEFGG